LVFYYLNEFCLKSSDCGSITEFKETEIPLLGLEGTHPSFLSPTATAALSSADGRPAISTRTTRSRSRVVETAKSPSPVVEKQPIDASHETRPFHTAEELPSTARKPSSPSTRSTEIEPLDEDEDNDELDLIGPSTSPLYRERLSPQRITANKIVNTIHHSISKREVAEQEPSNTLPISESPFKGAPVSPAAESSLTEGEQEEPAEASIVIEGIEGRTTLRHPNYAHKETPEENEGMEVDEKNEITEGQNMERVLEVDKKMEVDQETKADDSDFLPTGTPGEYLPSRSMDVLYPALDTARDNREPPLDISMNLELKEIQDDARSNPSDSGAPVTELPKPIKYTPIHFPLPPSIQEAILIPIPTTNNRETAFNLDFAPEPLLPPSIPSNIENRQQYDPKYNLPPLNVLPADFIRKVKPRRKKDGKREKDDAIPMGLTRWGATIMANPLWKRVAKATKCLNTREWGVRDSLMP